SAANQSSPFTFGGLSAGSQTVTVIDSQGCMLAQVITVNQPTAVTLVLVETDAQCQGASDGTVTATFGGETAAYQVKIDAGSAATQSSPFTFSGLSAGSHTVTVIDSQGCTLAQAITVNQPTAVTLVLAETDAQCQWASDVTVSATFGGGTAPYQVKIDAGSAATQSSPFTFSGLSAGSHTVTVIDSQGCTLAQAITVNQPTAVTLVLAETDAQCQGASDGTVTAT